MQEVDAVRLGGRAALPYSPRGSSGLITRSCLDGERLGALFMASAPGQRGGLVLIPARRHYLIRRCEGCAYFDSFSAQGPWVLTQPRFREAMIVRLAKVFVDVLPRWHTVKAAGW
jgi:hypothetical protein